MVISWERGRNNIAEFHYFTVFTQTSTFTTLHNKERHKNVWFSIIEKENFKKEDKWLCLEIVIERCKIGDQLGGGALTK